MSYLNLIKQKFDFLAIPVAEETGLNLAISETPKTGFDTLRPNYMSRHKRFGYLSHMHRFLL